MQNSIYRFKLFNYRPNIESLPNWIKFESMNQLTIDAKNCVIGANVELFIIIIIYYYRLSLRFSFSYSIHGCWESESSAGNGFSYNAMKAKDSAMQRKCKPFRESFLISVDKFFEAKYVLIWVTMHPYIFHWLQYCDKKWSELNAGKYEKWMNKKRKIHFHVANIRSKKH